ncbi:hypothetical protein FGO68_gene12469 [Halteria grandinella]|uniref:Tubby C-terminal domain-containing protein n=1 Tax=Halteria grandinella TaxID=5974 RepID=A0A8J8P042_HALGN|nr:hypothetical protein FGO68_gene12469 [Halteria grandinella]
MRIDQREAHAFYINKLTNPFTSVEELRELFMRPVPPNCGQILCTIVRHKSGFNRLWPKYTLHLSDSNKFLLTGKKRSGNTTSNYMITLDQDKMKKGTKGYLGKLRSNFLGTEFYLYDDGDNPKKAKNFDNVRTEHGIVEYETNVLGSKGPRRMKVLLPMVGRDGLQYQFKSQDADNYISKQFKGGRSDNLMFFFNKPPKWNEQVQAFVLNFNGRVDKASVKNFQLIDEFDDNRIHMQFGRIGKQNFNMDVAFPFSIFQAFGIALSSFDFKFACE